MTVTEITGSESFVHLNRERPTGSPCCITDVSSSGGLTAYKIKLDSGATLLASMANSARSDIDAYQAGQRVVAWFTPDDCVVLEQ